MILIHKPKTFCVTAKDFEFEVMAFDSSSVITSFQELYPHIKQFKVSLQPEWSDDNNN